MTTSLAQQLKKLAVPETSIYKQEKKKYSILFDPKEAASIDRETFYEIGLSGLGELKTINSSFSEYEKTLFNIASKNFERSLQTSEINERINKSIASFLLRLSPYFLLQSSHKALEWLINRYHIHKYNKDELLGLILPYHETKVFVRCIQLLKINDSSDKWNWLEPLQKPGIPLAKSVLLNHCSSYPPLLQFISDVVEKGVEEFEDKAHLLSTLYSFYCSTVVGSLEFTPIIKEAHITSIIPGLLKNLESPIDDLRAAGFMITAQLVSKVQLKRKLINRILNKITLCESDTNYETVLLLHLLFHTQNKLNHVSETFINNLTLSALKALSLNINILIKEGSDVSKLVMALVKGSLKLAKINIEYLIRFKNIPEILVSEVNLDSASAEKLIKCAIDTYTIKSNASIEDEDLKLEIENETPEAEKFQLWFSSFLRMLESKYPSVFDKIIKRELKVKSEKKAALIRVLGFAPKLVEKLGDSFLFEKLYHHNSFVRMEATKYLVENFTSLQNKNISFLRESLIDRLNDDNCDVVNIVLKIDIKCLTNIVGTDELMKIFMKILFIGQNNPSWHSCINIALKFLCSLESALSNASINLSIIPYLFPVSSESTQHTHVILQSKLGKCFMPKNNEKKFLQCDDHILLCNDIFNILKNEHNLHNISDLLYVIDSTKNEDNYHKSKVFAIFLLSFALQHNTYPDESLKILTTVSKFVNSSKIFIANDIVHLSSENFCHFVKEIREGMIPIQLYTFFLECLIKTTNFSQLGKPWIANTVAKSDVDFIYQLYLVLIKGCKKKYEKFYSPVLRLFITKNCKTFKDKIEFLANFIIGNISQASEYDVVLQIRSLKIIFLQLQCAEEDLNWILESKVTIVMILLSLFSPFSSIREITFNTIHEITTKTNTKHHLNIFLKEFLLRKEEIQLDNEQVPLVISTLLSPDSTKHIHTKPVKISMKKSLEFIMNILTNEDTPCTVKSRICKLINYVNSGDILEALSPIAIKLLEDEHENDTILNVYESQILRNIISRITYSVLKSCFQKDIIWKMICTPLQKKNKKIMLQKNDHSFVCVLWMQNIDQDILSLLPIEKARILISLIIEAGTFGTDSSVVTSASKLIKKLELDAKHILSILTSMHQVYDSSNQSNLKKKKRTFIPSLLCLDTKEWKVGNTLLEYIQNKKKLSGVIEILPVLFSILKKCLDFEEQSAVEYTKQLLLTSILHCCQKLYPLDTTDFSTASRGIMDIELIVMCIRGTQNPQTHHHALMLLSKAAFIIPDQVLHHMMAIFTFIGSSVLRHDDAYSFQIITKIIETVIPILVKSDDIDGIDEIKILELEKRVIPVLRIFVDVCLDIPEHRRLPLFRKLILTLSPEHFLWVFSSLMFESHVLHNNEDKIIQSDNRKLENKEQPIRRLDFVMSLMSEFDPIIVMKTCVKLMAYLKTLPIDKTEGDENIERIEMDPTVIFSIPAHTAKHLRHFKYTIVTFLNNMLSQTKFTQQITFIEDKEELENLYKSFIVNILTYIQVVSKAADQNVGKPQAKYWKVMLHHSYEILDNINTLLPIEMFVMVIRGLMAHNLSAIRRKSMEILNTKLHHQASFFMDCDRNIIYTILKPLMNIISEIGQDDSSDGVSKQETELNQQTALLSLKLLVRSFAQDDPMAFKYILDVITNLTKCSVSGNLMASIVLCLAELCSNLKAHAISFLPKFMPALIKILKTQSSAGAPELVLLSVITAVHKIVETIPLFLSPYLEKLLYEFSILSAKWENKDSHKNSPVTAKLMLIKNKISSTIAPRVLIPVVSQCYSQLVKKNKFMAIGPAMNILAESFAGISGPEFTSLQQELTGFFLLALQFRNDYISELSTEDVDLIEGHVIKALVALVLKLSESSFKPLYFKIFDWAVRTTDEEQKDRTITFYRLSSSIAENLKGLFILFAGHFIKNSTDLLDACNRNKTEVNFFESEEKCCDLIESIIKTLHAIFLYDSHNFVNKDKFETIMQALVDQLDNEVGGMESLKKRATSLIIPCIAQFAVAIADDSLWKPLNYQILLKTRHNDSNIRLLGLRCMQEMAGKLGESWLPLLPESIPFLAELLEDEVQEVETSTQKAVQTLESVLGEPLQKYF